MQFQTIFPRDGAACAA